MESFLTSATAGSDDKKKITREEKKNLPGTDPGQLSHDLYKLMWQTAKNCTLHTDMTERSQLATRLGMARAGPCLLERAKTFFTRVQKDNKWRWDKKKYVT